MSRMSCKEIKKLTEVDKAKICDKILKLLFENNITKFKFRGTKSKFKLDVGFDDDE